MSDAAVVRGQHPQAPPLKSADAPRRGMAAGTRTAALAAALVLLTLVAFAPVRHNGFVLADDDAYIVNNAAVARGITAEGVSAGR